MALKKDNPIGQEELSVLQYIQQEHPVTVREVADHLPRELKKLVRNLDKTRKEKTDG